jgi:GAF domain-containing protein
VALWEEDFSEVRTYLDRLHLSGIHDFRSYFEKHPEVVTHALSLVKVLDLNRRALEFYPTRDKAAMLGSLDRILGPASLDMFREQLAALAEGERTMEREFLSTGPNGAARLLHQHLTVAAGSDDTLQRVLVSYMDTTERHRAETAIREQTALSEALRDAAAVLTSTLNRDEVLERVLGEIGRVVPHDAADIMLIEDGQAHVVRMRGFRESVLADLAGSRRLRVSEAPHLRYQVQTGLPLVIQDVRAYPGWPHSPETEWVRSYAGAPIRVKGEVIGFINVASANAGSFTQMHADRLQVFASQTAVALENARLFTESRRRAEELTALAEVSSALRTAPARAEMAPIILDKLIQLLRARGVALAMRDRNTGETVIELARGQWASITATRLRPGESVIGRVIQMGQPMITDDMQAMAGYSWPAGLGEMSRALAAIPLVAQGTTIGALWVGNDDGFSETQVRILMAVGDIAANAIHRATLHEQTEQRLQSLMALLSIEMAISASTDLRVSLEILLNQVTTILGVSAAAVLLLDPHSQMLTYAAGNGFRSTNMAKPASAWARAWSGVLSWSARSPAYRIWQASPLRRIRRVASPVRR